MVPPRSRPPISHIALSFLTQLIWRTWMLSTDKTVEIRLWEFGWETPYNRVLKRYSHVVFRMVKKLRKGVLGRTNIMAKLGRALGPFGSARAAYDAATTAGLKLGMSVEELELYMTRERVILKGPRKGEIPHFCLCEATISSTVSRSADITCTVTPTACAAPVASRPPIVAVQRGLVEATAAPAPVAAREPGSTLAALLRQAGTWAGSREAQRNVNHYRIVRHVHLSSGGSLIPSGHCAGRRGPAGPPAAPRRATARTLPPRQTLTEQNYTVSASVTDFKLKCRAGTVTVTDSNLKFQTQRIQVNTK